MTAIIQNRPGAILIIDSGLAGETVDYLEQRGFKIFTAGIDNFRQSIEMFGPDIILLDVTRSEGNIPLDREIDGIPIILMGDFKEAGLDNGTQCSKPCPINYLDKSLSKEEFLARVSTHLELHRLRQQNADKDRLFSIICHDLRGPFHSLLGYSEMLLQEADAPANIVEASQVIHQTSATLYALLEDLCAWFVGLKQVHRKNEALAALAQKAIRYLEPVAAHKNIRLENKIGPGLAVYADPNMTATVFRNLIANAIKFTPEGGQIVVSAQQTSRFVEVEVADTGLGISAENAAKLFQADLVVSTQGTNRECGMGFGLTLCKEMVKRNQGQIWIENFPGAGTRVKFTVPPAKSGLALPNAQREGQGIPVFV